MERKIRVRLNTDLTKYAKGLVVGTEGYTIGRQGQWSRGSDQYITVRFPDITTLDVLWKSLDILDEEVNEEIDRAQKQFREDLKTAREATLHMGTRGGFQALSLQYIDKESGTRVHYSTGSRKKAYEMMELLKEYEIPIKEKREQ